MEKTQTPIEIGQRIQVKQIDTAVVAKEIPAVPGTIHWIYADVIELRGDGALYVQIDHPGNKWNGARKWVKPFEFRTKTDVQADLDALPKNPIAAELVDLR